jgi:hypothetical protein
MANPAKPKKPKQPGQIATAPAGSYSLDTDPGVQSLRALLGQQLAFAEASALAAQKRLLIDYGDPNLATSTINDPLTALAAGQNPFSTLAQLGLLGRERKLDLDRQLGPANLWYSSTRERQYGLMGQDLLQRQYDAGRGIQDALTGINQGLVDTRFQARMAQAQEAQSAALRQQDFALQYGTDPSGAGSVFDPGLYDVGGGGLGLEPPARTPWQGQWGGDRFGPGELGRFKSHLAAHGTTFQRAATRYPGVRGYFGA